MIAAIPSPAAMPTYHGLFSSPVLSATVLSLLETRGAGGPWRSARRPRRRSPRRRRRRPRRGSGGAEPGGGPFGAGSRLLVRREGVVEVDDEAVDAAALLLGVLERRLVELGDLVEVVHEVGHGVGVERPPFD